MVVNLKKLRASAGISQQVLAEAIGVSQQSVNKYENHSVEPDITTLISIADYFGVSVDYLIGRTDDSDNIHLTNADIALLHQYKQLPKKEQTYIDNIIKAFNETK